MSAVTDDASGSGPHTGPWVDNHCHLGHPARTGDEPDEHASVQEALDSGVVAMIDVGTDAASSAAARDRAARHDRVRATAGVHPHEASGGLDDLRRLLDPERDPRAGEFVAIGECGLDHHYDHSPPEVQRRVFAAQIDLAHELGLPLVIHTREAWDETFELLDAHGVPERTVFHCFTGGPAEADAALERGAMLSVSGIVTFPSAGELRAAVRRAPLGSLMVETDAPYLAPVPHRGRPNRPALVGVVGAAVASVKDLPVADVAVGTTRNALRFYGLTDPTGG